MWIKNFSKVSVYLPLSLCLLYACDDSDETESTSEEMQMAGEEVMAGSEMMSGDEIIAGESMAGESIAGETGCQKPKKTVSRVRGMLSCIEHCVCVTSLA